MLKKMAVLVVALVAFSAFGQMNDDVVAFSNALPILDVSGTVSEAMATLDPYATEPVQLVLSTPWEMNANATNRHRRRAVRSAPSPEWRAAIDVVCFDAPAGEPAGQWCRSGFLIYTPLPVGTLMWFRVLGPNGEVFYEKTFSPITTPPLEGGVWVGWLYHNGRGGPIPAEWKAGTEYELVVSINNVLNYVSAELPIGSSAAMVGPVSQAAVDGQGGITLSPAFAKPPVVVAASYRVGELNVEGTNFVPPGQFPLPQHVTICPEVEDRRRACSTFWAELSRTVTNAKSQS